MKKFLKILSIEKEREEAYMKGVGQSKLFVVASIDHITQYLDFLFFYFWKNGFQ